MNSTTLAALANFPDLLEANFAAVPIGLVHWRPASWEGIPIVYSLCSHDYPHLAGL